VTSHAISPCAYVNFSLVEKLNSRAREFFFETRAFRDSFTSLKYNYVQRKEVAS